MPSGLWNCWLGGRKGIQPVKTEWWGTGMLSTWNEVQMTCKWSSWWHCHSINSCFIKIQNGLPFWCRLTRVVLEKRPLNRYSVVHPCNSQCIIIPDMSVNMKPTCISFWWNFLSHVLILLFFCVIILFLELLQLASTQKATFWDNWSRFFYNARCPFCQPINSVTSTEDITQLSRKYLNCSLYPHDTFQI